MNMKTFCKILTYGKKYYGTLIITVIALIAVALTNFVTPAIVRILTGELTGATLTSKHLFIFVCILLGTYILRALCRFLAMWLAHVAAWGIVADLTAMMYDKLLTFSPEYYDNKQTGQLMSRVINDTRSLEVLFAHALPDLLVNLLIVVGVGVAILCINPTLGALTLIPLPFVLIISTQYTRKIAPLFKRNQRFLGEMNADLQDRLTGMREIQATTNEGREHIKMRDMCRYYFYVNVFANRSNAVYQPCVELLTMLGTAIVLGVGGAAALDGRVPAADLVGFFMFLSLFYTPLTTLGRVLEDIHSSMAGADRILEVMNYESRILESPDAINLDEVKGDIAFRHVSFSYTEEGQVLDGVDFDISAGQTVAFVGSTGAGKSTIVSLLERFYDVESGSVTLDGHDLRDLTLNSIRRNVSVVMQDVFLFNGTIYDNIAYGAPTADIFAVKQAAMQAHIDEYISSLPDGYNTYVGERGVQLSGGQRQRIAIARALLRNTPILIFDEATSAVDNRTEREIQDAVNELQHSRTIIIIAHRLTTVRNADKIIVLSDGKIAEQGTHEELIALDGEYAAMQA